MLTKTPNAFRQASVFYSVRMSESYSYYLCFDAFTAMAVSFQGEQYLFVFSALYSTFKEIEGIHHYDDLLLYI